MTSDHREGFAKKHPDWVAAYIQAAAMDLCATTLAQQLRKGLGELADAIENLARAQEQIASSQE